MKAIFSMLIFLTIFSFKTQFLPAYLCYSPETLLGSVVCINLGNEAIFLNSLQWLSNKAWPKFMPE